MLTWPKHHQTYEFLCHPWMSRTDQVVSWSLGVRLNARRRSDDMPFTLPCREVGVVVSAPRKNANDWSCAGVCGSGTGDGALEFLRRDVCVGVRVPQLIMRYHCLS